jgi:dolichol-phosphate mannosyltransferase
MFSWVGFRQTGVAYTREERYAGTTHYTLSKMMKLASNGILGFSTAPLRLALSAGVFLAIASVIYGVVVISLKLAGVSVPPGQASLLFAITFLSGIQLSVMGMVGLYVARIYDEARARPLYVVRERHGFSDGEEPVIWQPAGARDHNGHGSAAARPRA